MTKKYITNDELYFVYSLNMFHFLKSNGHWFEYKVFDEATKRYTFVFKKTDELMEAVTYYIKNNSKPKESR